MTTPILLKDTAGSVTAFLERASDGSAATGLTASDLQVDIKKNGGAFAPLTLIDPASATADIGSGANGTVTTTVDTPGLGGNAWTIEVTVPAGTAGLSVTVVGTAITVALAVIGGVPDNAQNTAALVAAAITAESGVTASASGTGADPLTAAEGPTTFTGGLDGTFREFSLGFYEIDLAAADTSTLGSLYLRVTGPTIRSTLIAAYVAAVAPTNPTATQPPALTTLYGFVYGADGSPLNGVAVSARTLSQPTLLHPQTEGLVLGSGLVTTKTSSDGFFTLSLVAGTQVDIFISAAGYRRTLLVPSTSTNLFDIP